MVSKHPLADCDHCPLKGSENAFVPTKFARGETKLVVVGEAPGFQEATYKEPFVGPSGKLIKKVLAYHSYQRDEVAFTNAVLCRPPDNATPPKAAINACRGRLYAEIQATGCEDVLALGNTASSVLVDDQRSISHVRVGSPKRPVNQLSKTVTRVVATWHPAYCLRTSDAFPTLVGDVSKLLEVSHEPWREPNWAATDDPAVALELIRDLERGTGPIVVDIETGLDKDTSFDHPNEYDLLCVGLADSKERVVVLGSGALEQPDVRDALQRFLVRRHIIAHNGKFDLAGLYKHFRGLKLWFDTMLAHYCLDERTGAPIHGLKVLAVEKLGAPNYEEEIRQYIPRRGNYADIPRQILYKYNAYDVACTFALYEMFSSALDRPGPWPYPDRPKRTLRDVHDHLVAASNELMYLELNGIAVDLTYNFQLGAEYEERIEKIEGRINDIVGSPINPRSPKQITAYLHDQGISVSSTNVDTLKLVLGRLDPRSNVRKFVSALLEHRRQAKLNSTYVQGIHKRVYRGRVYTTYLLHGTTSGRLASRNPNLQNVVRDKAIKRQFAVSKPDRIFVHVDYKQAEARVMATLAQDVYLQRVLSDPNIDIFDDLCYQIHGADWIRLSDVEKKELRIRIKAFFYGLGYGREAPSIAAEFRMPIAQAFKLQSDFFDLIPGVVAWQNEIKAQVLRRGVLVTPFGRRRRFHLITDGNKREVLNEALSYLPQSTASDICLSALVKLRPALKGLGFIRLTIHDALVIECLESRKDEVAALVAGTMVQCGKDFTDYVPFPVDVSYGKSWGDL